MSDGVSIQLSGKTLYTGVEISKKLPRFIWALHVKFWGASQTFKGPDFLLFLLLMGLKTGLLSPKNLWALWTREVLIWGPGCNFAGHWSEGRLYFNPWLYMSSSFIKVILFYYILYYIVRIKIRHTESLDLISVHRYSCKFITSFGHFINFGRRRIWRNQYKLNDWRHYHSWLISGSSSQQCRDTLSNLYGFFFFL